jgi:membrane protease subunit (stomatin/prohibitin family)
MGLMEKLRAEFVDIVEWIDDSRHTLVWRYPRFHNQIKQGAQLIVRPGQVAVLVAGGKLGDVFEPGTHTLATGNLPVLSTLLGWKHGFDSPFKAEVYFVSTRLLTELKWGTPKPVIVRDPDLGPIRVRAFGTYTLRATDPKALIRELVGTDGLFEAEEMGVLLRSIIASVFAEVVATTGVSIMDLASSYPEISERLRRAVVERVDDEYGLDVPQLYVVNVSLPAEVEQALDARSGQQVIGDLAGYQQYQLGRSMPVAAANPAGGLAGAGVGVGMGMAYAQAGPGGGVPPAPGGARWHVAEGGRSVGPFDDAALQQAIRDGRVGPDTMVWAAGLGFWVPASQVPALAALFAPPPPPPAA